MHKKYYKYRRIPIKALFEAPGVVKMSNSEDRCLFDEEDFNILKEKLSLQTTEQIVRAVEYALADSSGYVTEVVLDNPIHILSL